MESIFFPQTIVEYVVAFICWIVLSGIINFIYQRTDSDMWYGFVTYPLQLVSIYYIWRLFSQIRQNSVTLGLDITDFLMIILFCCFCFIIFTACLTFVIIPTWQYLSEWISVILCKTKVNLSLLYFPLIYVSGTIQICLWGAGMIQFEKYSRFIDYAKDAISYNLGFWNFTAILLIALTSLYITGYSLFLLFKLRRNVLGAFMYLTGIIIFVFALYAGTLYMLYYGQFVIAFLILLFLFSKGQKASDEYNKNLVYSHDIYDKDGYIIAEGWTHKSRLRKESDPDPDEIRFL